MLWSTTIIPQARPCTCIKSSSSCSSSTAIQVSYLCCSFVIMSTGSGGIRASSVAFGTDQLKLRDSLKNSVPVERFLNKACIIRFPQQYSSADEINLESWNVCTVDQVEDFKDEFYFSEFPRSMSCIALTLRGLGIIFVDSGR
ncbi:hypothetical protein POM88_032006 [Heracleum sosnowskyi]|uniref:Uncharacterized protein n=1 Tax=Heracleum sosnowskyi TaxID=360622 RepID=A0AAD8MKV4_9APIA|nr:hypothetical protein POM88_032006 [Heracleum sosnowskyi]